MPGNGATHSASYRWIWCLSLCLGSGVGCDMIWGEDEGNSKSPPPSHPSSQVIDRLVAEVRLLRQEVRELRDSAEQRDRSQEQPAAKTSPLAKTATDPEAVLLYFTATWCGPCQQMNPIVDRLKREGFPILVVDVDKEPTKTEKLGVSSIPCFQLMVSGKPVDRYSGIASEKQLRKMFTPRNAASTRVTPLRD